MRLETRAIYLELATTQFVKEFTAMRYDDPVDSPCAVPAVYGEVRELSRFEISAAVSRGMKPVTFLWTYSNKPAVLICPVCAIREARVNFRELVASEQ